MSAATRLYRWTLPLIALGLVLLALPDRDNSGIRSFYHYFRTGLAFGTLFGQATVVALWTALGPAGLRRRLTVAAIWLALLVASILIGLTDGPSLLEGLTVLGASLGSQW